MDTVRPISPSRTLPLKGVQHITSPSVPSVALGNRHLPQLPYKPIVSTDRNPYPPALLHDIGPSARVLLSRESKNRTQTDKGKRSDDKKKSKNKHEETLRQFVASKAATFSHYRNTAAASPDNCREKSQHHPLPCMLQTYGGDSTKAVSAHALDLSKRMNQTCSGTRDMANTMTPRSSLNKTVPPFVTALERYIHREMSSILEKKTPLLPQDRLPPFREAFFTFIDAFPTYGTILNDIMSAYDGVIQDQAKALADIISERSQQELTEKKHLNEVMELKGTITDLMKELQEAHNVINEGQCISSPKVGEEVESEPRLQRTLRSSREKDKMLQDAKKQITELGEVIKSELEKQLVLINALRESDKRTKSLELQLASLNAQMDELGDFKVMAGEAQKQLEEFKLKYQNFISVQDHELIRDYLKGELQAAQNTVRQYRRSAAVRGTQVDVIGRKLKALQEENKNLLEKKEDSREELLTPRPNWKKIHSSLPDLKEITAPVKAIALEGDEAITSTVPGLTETRLQVDYLVETINSLSQELERRKMVLNPMKPPILPLIGQGLESRVPLHLRACGIVPRMKLDPVEVLLLVHDFFRDVLQPHPDVLLHTLDIPALYKEFLLQRIRTREALKGFLTAEYLAINLADITRDKEICRPSFLLLDGILSGMFPARIACDVMLIIENVRFELKSLSEEQKKTRLRRIAISDCIAPVLQLKTLEEVTALRETMGSDTTHDVEAFCSTGGKFMSTLFDQECSSGMKFYVSLLERLGSYAYFVHPESTDLVITLKNVVQAIAEVEPLTPKVVLKEITENFTEKEEKDEETVLHLSDVIHVLAAAPVMRRSAQTRKDEGVL